MRDASFCTHLGIDCGFTTGFHFVSSLRWRASRQALSHMPFLLMTAPRTSNSTNGFNRDKALNSLSARSYESELHQLRRLKTILVTPLPIIFSYASPPSSCFPG